MENYTYKLAKTAAAKKALSDKIACGYESSLVEKLSGLTDTIAVKAEELSALIEKISSITSADGTDDAIIAQSYFIRDEILPKMAELRAACDEAETLTAKSAWPFPSYGDLLFSVR